MNDETVATYRKASEAQDINGLIRTLADDVELIPPLSDRVTFRGADDVRVVLTAVYGSLRTWTWHSAIGNGERLVLVGTGRIGPFAIGDAMVIDFDGAGKIRRLRPHLRPLPGLLSLLAVLAAKLGRHPRTLQRAVSGARRHRATEKGGPTR